MKERKTALRIRRHQGRVEITRTKPGHLEIKSIISGELHKEDRMWVSVCPPLDLVTCGPTNKEALDNTQEAIAIFFKSCIERGTLEKALLELGWKKDDVQILTLPIHLEALEPIPPAFVIDKVRKDGTWKGTLRL